MNDMFEKMAEIAMPDNLVDDNKIIVRAKGEASRLGANEYAFLSGYYESKIKILCTLINAYGSKELKMKINSII